MTKNEWFKSFQRELGGLSFDEAQRAVDYYRELYADKADAGMKENDIIKSFGSPALAAQEILQNGVNYERNCKDEAPMPEFTSEKGDFSHAMKDVIVLILLLFVDSVLFSLAWNIIQIPALNTIDALTSFELSGILINSGLTLIAVGVSLKVLLGVVKATVKRALRLAKGGNI